MKEPSGKRGISKTIFSTFNFKTLFQEQKELVGEGKKSVLKKLHPVC